MTVENHDCCTDNHPTSQKQVQDLIELVRNTRKCHIKAEKRLLALSKLTSHANLYYGCIAAILTLLTLISTFDYLSVPSACFASAVALWATYSSVEKYESRARGFYESYLALQELWFDCERVQSDINSHTDSENQEIIKECQERYSRILHTTENHTEEDFWRFQYDKDHLDKESRKRADHFHRIYCLKYYAIRFAVYVIVPLILLAAPKALSALSLLLSP